MRRLNERNCRIEKILKDMDMDEPVNEVKFDSMEYPECLLEVNDSEITVEKYISEEQRVRLDEEAAIEEGV